MKANGPDVQARDKDTGERVWSVRVRDADPAARTAELKVKILGETAPALPDLMPGTPLRPAVFEGLAVVSYVNANGRVAFSLRAATMRPAGPARRSTPAVAA